MFERVNVAAEPGKPTITMTRIFDAPRRIVFDAWTKAEHVAHWWDPGGVPLAVCEIDLRPNGTFRWVNAGTGAADYPFTGMYREIVVPERLVFTAKIFPASPDLLGILTLIEEGAKTKLTLTIECPSVEDRDALLKMRIDAGTAQTLENLAKFLSNAR